MAPDFSRDDDHATHGRPALGGTEAGRNALLALIENVSDQAIILLDCDGYVESWNAGARELKGYEPDEALGMHFSAFYPPEANAVGHPERELEIAASMGRFEEEGWRVRKDETRFFAHVVITAIHDEHGGLVGFGKTTRDLTHQKQAEEQQANTLRLLERTARTDSLTGLPNRRAWDEALARELARATRTKTPLAISVIDIDSFKKINDEHGHGAGDRFLKRAATRWNRTLRKSDLLARWGGEEFCACLPDCDLDGAVDVIERLRDATPDGFTCSAGIALWDTNESLDSLLGRADKALYQAKSDGKNKTVTFGQIRPV